MSRQFALVFEDTIYEVRAIDGDPRDQFHPDLEWVDITEAEPEPKVGWRRGPDGLFSEPVGDL